MAYRKSTLGIFIACIGLFPSGYDIMCDSLKSFRHLRSLNTFNLSHDLSRTIVLRHVMCTCDNEVDITPDEHKGHILLLHMDFREIFVPSQTIPLYWYISVLNGQYSNFDFSSRIEHLKTKLNPDSYASRITETESTLKWIHGRIKAIHMSVRRANESKTHSNSVSVSNSDRTLQNFQKPLLKLDHETFDLRTGIKLSVILIFVLTRVISTILLNVPQYLNKIGKRTVKGDIPNSTNLWGLLKHYLESRFSFIDQHHCGKNGDFDSGKKFESMKKVLGDPMSTLSPPRQDIVVAPVTELSEYFESMSHLDTSKTDVSLNIEILRIETFRNFPRSAPVSTIRLAENGFFYTGEADEVECFHCHAQYSGWKTGDTPFDVHMKISPDCDFVLGMDTINVPLLQKSRPNSNQSCRPPATQNWHASTRDVRGPPEKGNAANESNHQCIQNSNEFQSNAGLLESKNVSHHNNIKNERHRIASAPASHSNTSASVSHSNTYDPVLQIINGGQRNQTQKGIRFLKNETGVEEGSIRKYHHQEITDDRRKQITCLENNNTNQTGWRIKYSGKLRLRPLADVRKTVMYPAYAVPTIRLSSYKGWSSTSGHTPRSLSEAGFIYAGYGDQVRCFCCGGALRNWLLGDDPWIEHARWFPECVYLRQSKGDNFIFLVHDDVKLPKMIKHSGGITPQSASGLTGHEGSTTLPEITNQYGPDAFSERVMEMGFSMDTISSTVTLLQRQGKPIDAFNIINEILSPETITERIGLDEVDGCQKRETVRESNSLVQGVERRIPQTRNKCKICLEGDVGVMFLPCQHVVCCNECGPVLHKCPVCREVIRSRFATQ